MIGHLKVWGHNIPISYDIGLNNYNILDSCCLLLRLKIYFCSFVLKFFCLSGWSRNLVGFLATSLL